VLRARASSSSPAELGLEAERCSEQSLFAPCELCVPCGRFQRCCFGTSCSCRVVKRRWEISGSVSVNPLVISVAAQIMSFNLNVCFHSSI